MRARLKSANDADGFDVDWHLYIILFGLVNSALELLRITSAWFSDYSKYACGSFRSFTWFGSDKSFLRVRVYDSSILWF